MYGENQIERDQDCAKRNEVVYGLPSNHCMDATLNKLPSRNVAFPAIFMAAASVCGAGDPGHLRIRSP